MNEIKKTSKSKGCLIFGLIIIAIIMIVGTCNKDDDASKIETKGTQPVEVSLKERLQINLDSFEKPRDSKHYAKSLEGINIQVAVLMVYSNLIFEAKTSKDQEVINLASKLRKKVSAYQLLELPKMRKAYVKIAAEKMWENDIYITGEGKRTTTINLTGGIFARNKNMQETQESLQEMLTSLRFKQARYRWYKNQDEFTYYDITVKKDSELY